MIPSDQLARPWCLEIPEVVNISVNTPCAGTETWFTESRHLVSRDYRLFDIQHAVLPTRPPLRAFYEELVATHQSAEPQAPGSRADLGRRPERRPSPHAGADEFRAHAVPV